MFFSRKFTLGMFQPSDRNFCPKIVRNEGKKCPKIKRPNSFASNVSNSGLSRNDSQTCTKKIKGMPASGTHIFRYL